MDKISTWILLLCYLFAAACLLFNAEQEGNAYVRNAPSRAENLLRAIENTRF